MVRHATIMFMVLLWSIEVMSQCPEYRTEDESTITDEVLRAEVRSFHGNYWMSDTVLTAIPVPLIPASSGCLDTVTFEGSGVLVRIEATTFDSTKHRLTYDHDYPLICGIDDLPVWGTDGNMPKRQITSFRVRIDGAEVPLPFAEWQNLYEAWFCHYDSDADRIHWSTKVGRSGDGRRVYVSMNNGDAAGSYSAVLIFLDNKYYRRVIDRLF
jgi:hypothetical protein